MGKGLVAVAVFVVFVILCLGLYTMMKGGTTSATYSNKLMRLRVVAQFVAILLIMAVLALSQSGSHERRMAGPRPPGLPAFAATYM